MAGPRGNPEVSREDCGTHMPLSGLWYPNYSGKPDPPSFHCQPWDPGGSNILGAEKSDRSTIGGSCWQLLNAWTVRKEVRKTTRGVGKDPVCSMHFWSRGKPGDRGPHGCHWPFWRTKMEISCWVYEWWWTPNVSFCLVPHDCVNVRLYKLLFDGSVFLVCPWVLCRCRSLGLEGAGEGDREGVASCRMGTLLTGWWVSQLPSAVSSVYTQSSNSSYLTSQAQNQKWPLFPLLGVPPENQVLSWTEREEWNEGWEWREDGRSWEGGGRPMGCKIDK